MAAASSKLKAPFAVKVVSRDVPHKTEAGGVKLGVSKEGLAEAARVVSDNAKKHVPGATIDGVLVSEMASGLETLIGVINDPSFGPMVALGLGGVFTEVLKDVTYRVAPFDIETAREMIARAARRQAVRGLSRQAAGRQGGAGRDAGGRVEDGDGARRPASRSSTSIPSSSARTGAGVVAADALVVLK